MSADSNGLLQRFQQILNGGQNSSTDLNPSPLKLLGQRSGAFADWRISSQEIDVGSSLLPDSVSRWVESDVLAFHTVTTADQRVAANHIYQNISSSKEYAVALRNRAPDLFERIYEFWTEKAPLVLNNVELEGLLIDSPQVQKRLKSMLPTDWKGKVEIVSINDSVLGDVHELRALRESNNDAKRIVAVASHEQAMLLAKRFETIASSWPVAQQQPPAANGFGSGVIDPEVTEKPTPFDPQAIISKLLENVTYKPRADGAVVYMVSGRDAFIDHGQQILMATKASEDDEAILAAILLAKEKFGGTLVLTGSDVFKRRALDIMQKHKIAVELKDPHQHALQRELTKNAATTGGDKPPVPAAASDTKSAKTVIGTPASSNAEPNEKSTTSADQVITNKTPKGPLAADLSPLRARDWWHVQRTAIHIWATNDGEYKTDLAQLGAKPPHDQIFWFDRTGRPCDPPVDADSFANQRSSEQPGFESATNYELRQRDAMNAALPRAGKSDVNHKELLMEAPNDANSNEEKPEVVLRGLRPIEGKGVSYETNLMLVKGTGNYLQGYVRINDEKRHVIGFINERKPDEITGERKPNYVTLAEKYDDGDKIGWRVIGHGNAINRRKEGQTVFFDEFQFNVDGHLLNARVADQVDPELHKRLGFQEPRLTRPPSAGRASLTTGDASPKPLAPAALSNSDAAGAPKEPKQPSRPSP